MNSIIRHRVLPERAPHERALEWADVVKEVNEGITDEEEKSFLGNTFDDCYLEENENA